MVKEHLWFKYGRQGEIVEIIVRDMSGAKLDKFKCDCSDKEGIIRISRVLKEKYGISFAPNLKR